MDLDDDLALAQHLADVATKIALGFFRSAGLRTEWKDDGSPVTEADLAVEDALVSVLRTHRPGDGIVSEESGEVATGERRWLLDPIDGTVYFERGDHGWGTHVALEEAGEIRVAVITRPVANRNWWARAGRGAFAGSRWDSGHRLQVGNRDSLQGARVGVFALPGSDIAERLQSRGVEVSARGSHITDLVDGTLDAVVADRGCGFPWDHAPGVLLVSEAGGRFTDPRGGQRHDLRAGLYSNAVLHGQLVDALGPDWCA